MGTKNRMSANLTVQLQTYYTYSNPINNLTTRTASNMGKVGFSRTGQDLMYWRSVIASGGDAHCNLAVTKRKASWEPGWICRKTKDGAGWYMRCTDHAGLAPVSFAGHLTSGALLDAEQTATVGFLKKIRSEREVWAGPEFLGELSKTKDMLRHPLRGLMDLGNELIARASRDPCRLQRSPRGYRKCRRRAERLARKQNREIPASVGSAWLEFQFGARPLVGMISDIADQLTDFQEPELKRVGFIHDAETASSSIKVGTDVNFCAVRYSEVHKTTVSYKLRCQISREGNIEKGSVAQFRETGFAWDSLVPTAWELLPLSVFIDYVSNIGDLISAGCVSLDGVRNTSMTEVTQSQFTRGNVVLQPSTSTHAARDTQTISSLTPTFSCTETTISRRKPSLNLEPRFRLKMPSSGQGLNLAAFLASLLKL
nr:MAG: putative maturation protein [Leviviridae sp.]